MLLYVGGMDTYHDMGPVIDALARISVPLLELHLVGDGEFRGKYEARAKHARVPVRFHGQVSHEGFRSLLPRPTYAWLPIGWLHFLTKQCRFRR